MTPGRRIVVRGTVQGVGFRPWVYRLAHDLGVRGRVRNDPQGVTIEAFGGDKLLDDFVARLHAQPPPPAAVRELRWTPILGATTPGFEIDDSGGDGAFAVSIPPDLATCPACLAEARDPRDRRFGYPFVNCTACGPRFTIALDVPYDRPATTMARFPMCPRCRREHGDPGDRRFHAQPNACPVCGPRLVLEDARGEAVSTPDPLAATARFLGEGAIVAVKGLGGFHLACDARCEAAVALLRSRKQRDQKPFAVMVADVEAARALAFVDDEDAAVLTSVERPITLVRRRPGAAIAADVAPDTPLLGVFLPYSPLHHLLVDAFGGPLVMTSGNRSDEPIAQDNDEARRDLAGIADYFLLHDRPIATRCDDSVARVVARGPMLLRRSRGYVPRPVALRRPLAAAVLACGGQLKNTFCLARGDSAYLGPHVGDLDHPAALRSYGESIARMERLVHIRPEIVAHDLHPDYMSTRYALERPELDRVAVQHHHAHVASAMAEHGLDGPVLGVAYDGSGYGPDGAAWGGELLLCTYAGYDRLATFRPVALAGGDLAIHRVWRIALALLVDAFEGEPPLDALPVFADVPARDVRVVRQMIASGLHAPPAHGVGRLFDGLGALILGRTRSAYEGQVAMAWNHAADPAERGRYPVALDVSRSPWVVDPRPLVRAAVGDLLAGRSAGTISGRFHRALVAATAEVVRVAVGRVGRLPVLLTGGCFANPLLCEGLLDELRDLDVRIQRAVPSGDGGIALGQAVVADAQRR